MLVVLAALVLGYAALSHYSNDSPNAKGLAVALSIGPVLLIALVLVYRWTGWLGTALGAALSGGLLYRYLPAIENNYEWLDLVQQAAAYALLASSFARSLLPGQIPLCTQLAVKMHGPLAPVELDYTRRATVAWVIFYVLLTVAIVTLFFAAPLRIWSLFVNFATFGLIILMALGDYGLRRMLLPPRPSGGVLAILQRALLG